MFRSITRRTAFLSIVATTAHALEIPRSALATIHAGKIAVIPDFMPMDEVRLMRCDAANLHADGVFTNNYSTDLADDRQVLRLKPWMDAASAKAPRGSEFSYSRYGPGASLARHIDEHHEELKGVSGWRDAGRRSVSWLVYLNEGWAPSDGGALRCYERLAPAGARGRDVRRRPPGRVAPRRRGGAERPVFLDSRLEPGGHGLCAFYVLDDDFRKRYVSRKFRANPALFVADGGTDAVVKAALLDDPDARRRFVRLEPLKSRLPSGPRRSTPGSSRRGTPCRRRARARALRLGHAAPRVLATKSRERFAISGWFHEARSPVAGT
ncbi:protein kinase [Aureococcus anophagefferens]|uniref:Protein kinase n=1 Tax=Aureococcus anophagefferens TaxID=44056 RepID=A0ABR1FGX7_AURAN